jgi:hypothetical protein
MPGMSSHQPLREALEAAAVAALGSKRAAALGADLDTFAIDLSRVASAPLPDDAEPWESGGVPGRRGRRRAATGQGRASASRGPRTAGRRSPPTPPA